MCVILLYHLCHQGRYNNFNLFNLIHSIFSTSALDGSDPETCYAVAASEGNNKFSPLRKTSIEFINKCKRRNSAQQTTTNEKTIVNKNRVLNVQYQLCIYVITDGVLFLNFFID